MDSILMKLRDVILISLIGGGIPVAIVLVFWYFYIQYLNARYFEKLEKESGSQSKRSK